MIVHMWHFVQLITTIGFISLYPFIVCLLFQIQHDMASNPWKFQLRKIKVVSFLVAQFAIITFLRDQYVWNEDVNDHKTVPSSLLCGLARFLLHGVVEPVCYYLILMIIWDEIETQNIKQYRLNIQKVKNIKTQFGDKRFYFGLLFKIYTFCVSIIVIIPSSILPSFLQPYFLNGIGNYKCEISDAANAISLINKIIFLLLSLFSFVKLVKIKSRYHISNIISFCIIIPISVSCSIFSVFTENWLNILSLDDVRMVAFISLFIFSVSMICNNIMMQSQGIQQISKGMKRVSTFVVRASVVARKSLMGTRLMNVPIKNNKITVEDTQDRFSVAEMHEDEYDSVVIEANSKSIDIDSIPNNKPVCDDNMEETKATLIDKQIENRISVERNKDVQN